MPKSDNQKLKILYIPDYLQKNSHPDKPIRAAELMAHSIMLSPGFPRGIAG